MAKHTKTPENATTPPKDRVVFPKARRCDLSLPNARTLREYPDEHAWLNHAGPGMKLKCIVCNRCFSPDGGFNAPLGA